MYIYTLHVLYYKLYISRYNKSYINIYKSPESLLVPLPFSLMMFLLGAENKACEYLSSNP